MKYLAELFDLTKRYVKACRRSRKFKKMMTSNVRKMLKKHQNAGKEVVNA
ncbi:MAG: hypothetical protein IJQ53_00600 [Clostridia bacterium]|nr:hypothetical protein [Clostridia bacterium]